MENSAESPLVSIIIPTYNHRDYVMQTVDSGLNQTYPAIEVIVVDDGSTDGTGTLLTERYGDRIRYVYQENQGVGAARNNGAQIARGEFVHFCDADDQLLPEKVARCMAVFRDQPEIALVYTQCHYVEPDGRTIIPREQPELPAGDVFCQLLHGPRGNFVPQCTPLIRRQAVLDVGGFSQQLRAAEDWDMWLRLAARYPFGVVNEPLALYRMLPNAMHTDPVRMATARLQVIQMARSYPNRARCLDDAAYDRLEASRHHVLAMALWEQDQRAKARHHLRAAIRLTPAESSVRRVYVALSYGVPAAGARALVRSGSQIRSRLKR
ncbi:MAG: glycosyltransferase [Anaerolineae bacterium]|nr:glycosyltransferase [Anaerolineae bacterium]